MSYGTFVTTILETFPDETVQKCACLYAAMMVNFRKVPQA